MAAVVIVAALAVGRISRGPDHFAALGPYVVSEKVEFYAWPQFLAEESNPVMVRTIELKHIDRAKLHETLRSALDLEVGWDLPPLAPRRSSNKIEDYFNSVPGPFYASKPAPPSITHTTPMPRIEHTIRGKSDQDYELAVMGCFPMGPSLEAAGANSVREFRPLTKLEYWMVRVEHLGRDPFKGP